MDGWRKYWSEVEWRRKKEEMAWVFFGHVAQHHVLRLGSGGLRTRKLMELGSSDSLADGGI